MKPRAITDAAYERVHHRQRLRQYLIESNRIEAIFSPVNEKNVDAFEDFLNASPLTIERLGKFVRQCQRSAVLRSSPGMDVRVGNHIPPGGGPEIVAELRLILGDLPATPRGAYLTHSAYETLHPFSDGNGRSGRALWAWQMTRAGYDLSIGFLHKWYYQSLEFGRTP